MKTALQKFEVAYLSYLEQTRKLIEAQKQTPPIDKPFDGDFAAFNNSKAAIYVREIVNPIREKIQNTVKEIDELIPYVYPINDDEVNDWIKSEIRCFCGIEKNNFITFSHNFSLVYNNTPTKFDFIEDWLNKNNIRDLPLLLDLYILLYYIEIENLVDSSLWSIIPLFNYVLYSSEMNILIKKAFSIYENYQIEDNTIVLNLLSIVSQLPVKVKNEMYTWIKGNIRDMFIVSQLPQ